MECITCKNDKGEELYWGECRECFEKSVREVKQMDEHKCNCKDLPVTYCRDCKRFFVIIKEGNETTAEEIMMNRERVIEE